MGAKLKQKIDAWFSTEEGKYFIEESNPIADIKRTEELLGVKLATAHSYILTNYGAGYIAADLLPATKNERIKADSTILEFTVLFRDIFSELGQGERLEEGYVFSIDGSGDPIFVNRNKKVEMFYHDNGEFKVISESFDKFITENII